MASFIKHIIVFSFPILLFSILMEFMLRKIPNDYSYKCKYLNENSNKIEVLILGSSHTYYGINPQYLKENSFNAAYVSQSLNYDWDILNKYQKKWNNLKYIIVPVDYFSLYSTLETGIEKWRVKNYSIYYNIQGKDLKNDFELSSEKLSDNITRFENYYLNDSNNITCNKLGAGTRLKFTNIQNLIETGKAAATRHTVEKKDNLLFTKNVETIKSIVQFAKKINAKVIFITCPAYYTYYDNLEKNQLYNTLNFITEISSNNSNMNYYNFLYDTSFTDKDFFDADHLNEIGAKKFTIKIDSLIEYKIHSSE
ncbi:MAG: hypothetical protein ABJB05_03125 [Parafilimonas sp.]